MSVSNENSHCGLVHKNELDLQALLTQKSSSSNVQCVLWLKSSVPGRVGGRRKAQRRGTVSICLHVSFSLAFKRCLKKSYIKYDSPGMCKNKNSCARIGGKLTIIVSSFQFDII